MGSYSFVHISRRLLRKVIVAVVADGPEVVSRELLDKSSVQLEESSTRPASGTFPFQRSVSLIALIMESDTGQRMRVLPAKLVQSQIKISEDRVIHVCNAAQLISALHLKRYTA